MTLFTPPVNAREKELEQQRRMGREDQPGEAEAGAETHAEAEPGLAAPTAPGAAPHVSPGDRPAEAPPAPARPLPIRRIVVQAAITAAAFVVIWYAASFFLDQRALEAQRVAGERIQASVQAATDKLRVEQARLKAQADDLNGKIQVASDELTKLETSRDRLKEQVDARKAELDATIAQFRDFNDSTQKNRDQNESLRADNKVLTQQNKELRAEEESLGKRLKLLNRKSLDVFSRNKRVTAESDKLVSQIDAQRAALADLSGRLLDLSQTISKRRQDIADKAKKIETSRLAFVDGLGRLAKEYGRIAARNYGPVRLRYAGFARDARTELEAAKAQAIDADFGQNDAADIERQIEAYNAAAAVIGKSAEVRYLSGFDAAAEAARSVLVEAGIVTTVKEVGVKVAGKRSNQISYFGDDDDAAAARVHDLLIKGAEADYQVKKEDTASPVNVVIWVTDEPTPAPPSEGDNSFGGPPGDAAKGGEAPAPPAKPVPSVQTEPEPTLPPGADGGGSGGGDGGAKGADNAAPAAPAATSDAPPSANPNPSGDGVELPPGIGGEDTGPKIELVPSTDQPPADAKPKGG